MAINKNHEFEELDGVKCAIVEKNASQERVDFLKTLLEFNNYTVIVTPTPPPKVVPPAAVVPATESVTDAPPPSPLPPPPPASFTIGVSDVSFNPTNAVFGRLLKTSDGHVVTLAYWQQKEAVAKDEIPYFENRS